DPDVLRRMLVFDAFPHAGVPDTGDHVADEADRPSKYDPPKKYIPTENIVQGNRIGFVGASDFEMSFAWHQGSTGQDTHAGILLTSCADNLIGGTAAGGGNIVVNEEVKLVGYEPIAVFDRGRIIGWLPGDPVEHNLIQGNVIGLDPDHLDADVFGDISLWG